MTLKLLAAVAALVVLSEVSLAQFRPPIRDPRRPPSTVPPAQQPQQGNHPRTAPPPGSQTPNPQQPMPRSDGPPSNYRDQSPNPQQPPPNAGPPPNYRDQAPNPQQPPSNAGPPPGFGNAPDPEAGPGPVVFEKRCSNCNHVVSSDSKVGDTCPFCGTKWVYDEGNTVKTHSESFVKSATTSGANPFEMTAGRYAIVFAGLAIGALVVVLTIRFVINNL